MGDWKHVEGLQNLKFIRTDQKQEQKVADLAAIVKTMTALMEQFIASIKQQQQHSSMSGSKAGTSKRGDSRKEVGRTKPIKKGKTKQGSDREDEIQIHVLATAWSSDDDFRDRRSENQKKNQ